MSKDIHDLPVALVCFNRPAHTAQVLQALRRDGIRNLYVFCDGPRNAQDLTQVEAIGRLVDQIDWTTPKVLRRQTNLGLARSVVSAVNTVLADHETIILLEDDCVPKPNYFAFMQDCLSRYRDHDRVFGINGYCVPIPDELRNRYPYDLFFYPRIGSWGWATWRRAWKAYDTDLAGLYRRCLAEGIDLKQGGPDIPESVQKFLNGQPRDIWTLNWVLAVYLNRGYYIYPTVSQIQNVGFDGSGVHFGRSKSKFDYIAPDQPIVRFPDQPVLADELIEHYNSYFGGTKRSPLMALPPSIASAQSQFSPSTGSSQRRSIVHINTHDVAGGAAKVAWRLAEAQGQQGHQARLLVGYKKSESPHTAAFALEATQSLYEQSVRQGLLDYHHQGSHRLPRHPWVQQADILHLHNLHGNYFNPFSLPALSRARPVVWTLHDMQAMTGHCAYSLECMSFQQGCSKCPCPNLEHALTVDTSSRLLRDKQLIYDHSRLQIVVPSEWLRRHVQQSVLRNHPVELIYNGVETSTFKPYDKAAARHRFGLPNDRVIIGAVANGGSFGNHWKGGQYTQVVIDRVRARYPNCAFVSIGGNGSTALANVIQLPRLDDESELAMAYSALDIFLYTPLADNCPLVVLEAMSCGLPIVSFATGGVPELIRDGIDGWVVEYKNVAQTAAAVENLIADPAVRAAFSQRARIRAVEQFEHSKVAEQYQRLYERVLSETQRSKSVIPHLPLDKIHPFVKTPAFLEVQNEIRTTPEKLSSKQNIPSPQTQSIPQTAVPAKETRTSSPDVSIVIATKNRGTLLDAMLESLTIASRGISLEVIVIEGGSTDHTPAVLRKHGVTQVFNELEQLGPGRHSWPQLYNFGFARARGRYAMYASDDIVFGSESITQAVQYLDSLAPSVAGGIFFYKNLHTRPEWDKFGIDFTYGHKLLMNYGLIRMDAFSAVGGIDESYRFYCADGDLCYKLYQSGRQLVPLPGCFVVHNNVLDNQKNANAQTSAEDIARYKQKWKHFVSIEEPSPRRLLWSDEMADILRLPASLRTLDASIEHLWKGLSQFQYRMFSAAREILMQAVASGCDHPRIGEWIERCGPAVTSAPSKPIPSSDGELLSRIQRAGLWPPGKPLRLHLGCGQWRFDGYVNIDYPPSEHTTIRQLGADIHADITQLRFPDGSVDEIRLHHVFEHFNRVTALALLIRWQRWLKVGGVLCIETPDLMGSARTLLSDAAWKTKMAVVRHLAGDQAAKWAYHVDHWFAERFEQTLGRLGFGPVQKEEKSWSQEPYLSNVIVTAHKNEDRTIEKQLSAAGELLTESMVSPKERPTWEIWMRELRGLFADDKDSMDSIGTNRSVELSETVPEPVVSGCVQ